MSPRRDGIGGRARAIRLLLSDVDGVLTDSGVYYTDGGELLRRFSLRDGMGVERLRELAGVETGFVTGERSAAVRNRAEKLLITEIHLEARDKEGVLEEILGRRGLAPREVAYIGDDVNDLAVIRRVGLAACPADAVLQVKRAVHIVCESAGGHGAFREFAEILIAAREEE
ncbi:MAG: HAD hydrolase family protein [Candidatus Deferrimicrobium sp.]